MIWVHCGGADEVSTTRSLVDRLIEQTEASDLLITCDPDIVDAFGDVPSDVACRSLPVDTPTKCRAFLDDVAPRSLIWIGGALHPNLLRLTESQSVPATLINARIAGLLPAGVRWMPRATRSAVAAFARILTADGATATRLLRGGVPADRVKATGPIVEDPIPLPHDQYELTVMAEALSARPMWFAAQVTEPEIKHMAAAHMAAARRNHRLLLVLTPRDIDAGTQTATIMRDAGFRVGVRSEGDDPEAEHQVYIADLPDELGLWYRISPLSFVGGTLGKGDATSPFDPILLGSAVVHGPSKSPHEARFERLASVQACREVRSAGELGIAIGVLVSPEQCSRMAMAGWEEITRSADVMNSLVRDALDGVVTTGATP